MDQGIERQILEFAESRGDGGGCDRPNGQAGEFMTDQEELAFEPAARALWKAGMMTADLIEFSFGGSLEYRRLYGAQRLHVGSLTQRGRDRLTALRGRSGAS